MKNRKDFGRTLRNRSFLIALTGLFIWTAVFSLNNYAQSVHAEQAQPHLNTIKVDEEVSGEISMSFSTGNLITAATYGFAPGTAVLEDMLSGTTQLVGPGVDDTASAVTNIGFDFWFDGVRHSQFSVNANGLARLGPVVITTAFNNATSGLNTTVNAPKIAPYFEDLCVGTNGKIHFKTVGSAPNRKLVVEWTNMQVSRGTTCSGAGTGTFQMWLLESAGTTTPGLIQFVYGAGIGPSAPVDGGASIGLQSGAATNFASVTVSTDTVSYDTHDPLNAAGIAAGKSYLFTPTNVPAAPTGLTFAPVTGTSIQLNWTDNATNEVGYAIYRSTDGTNFTFVTQTAADATSFNDTGLFPGTTYFYQVYAAAEGALSSALSGSQATSPAGNDTCNGAGGNWNTPATWTDGSVPTGADNVTIGSGCTVTIDVTTAVALNVTVQTGGILQFIETPASTLTVTQNVTINSGGTVQSAATGTTVTHLLSVGENLTNNGILNFSTNADTAGAELRFTGTSNNTFSGTGATTDLRLLTINKGSGAINPNTSPVLEVNLSNMSIRGLSTSGTLGFLNTATFNGIVKFSGTNTFSNVVFQTAGYSIPSTGGFWLNNPNFTVNGQNGSPTMNGLLRISNGIFNVGTATGNSMGGGAGAQFIIEGGELNTAGRLQTISAVSYTQSGGTVNVCTIGNTATTACFGLTSLSNTFNLTGGTIVLVLPSGNATPLDYSVSASSTFTANPAGTTLQIGNSTTPASSTFRVLGNTPNILVSSGQTMNAGNATGGVIFFRGSTITNNGAIAIQGASSRFDFAASGPMTYAGSGTFGTAVTPFTGVGISANSPTGNNTTINAPIFVNRVNFFSGGFANSNQITFGDGAAALVVIQIGNTPTPTNAGSFDVAPNFNLGTSGQTILYLRETSPRTTGFEINPTRILNNLTHDNNNAPSENLTIAGGNLTATGAVTLTNGFILTGANTLFMDGTATRTNGYVIGNVSRNYAAAGAFTYHVGTANGYSPVAANVTAGTFPQALRVRAIQGAQPNIPSPSKALLRHWSLAGTGLTADLTFNYLDPTDIPATATEANFAILKYDGAFTFPGGTVDTAANTATINGVTSFSDWTLAEPAAVLNPGAFEFSNASYTVAENGGSATITVNRNGGSDGAVTVDYATVSGGSATGGATCDVGVDYINTSGTLSFGNAVTSQTFTVTICDDSVFEGDETVNLALSNPTGGATLGAQNTAVLTIIDNDSPPTGNVIVNPGNVVYATLGEAVAAINAGTHTGAVTVSINANTTETGPIVLNSSGVGSASYTSVVINPITDGVTVAGPSVQGRGLIELNGADNVTIDGDNPNTTGTNRNLTIRNTAENTVNFTSVIRIALATSGEGISNADNVAVRNVNVLGSATGLNISTATAATGPQNTTFGIFAGGGAGVTPTAVTSVLTSIGAGATASNLLIDNNSFNTVGRAVSINGSAATVFPGLRVRENFIGNPTADAPDQVYAIGVTVQGSADAIVSKNTVYVEGFIASSAANHGINASVNSTLAAATTGTIIEKNKINRVKGNNTGTWSAFGINLGGGTAHVIRNNFVSDIRHNVTSGGLFSITFAAFGIRIAGGTGHFIYHNSVNMFGVIPGETPALTAAFAMTATGQTGVDVRNNIFANKLTGGGGANVAHVSMYLPAGGTSAMNLTLNNNIYFQGTGPNNGIAQVGTTASNPFQAINFDPSSTTPASNLRSYTSTLNAAGTNDNASLTVDPQFVSDTDLHILPTSLAESRGVNVGVVDDIDGDPRPAVPDIGADEITVAGPGVIQFSTTSYSVNEGGTATINVIRSAGTDGTVGVTATITDGTATGGAACTAGIDYINPGVQTLTFGDGVSLQSFTIQTCSDATLKANETVILTLSNATGGATIGANNPATLTIVDVPPPFSGTVNVGTGEIFTSLTNPGGIFEAINEAGLSNNLTVNITSDLTAETGAVFLNQFTETGAGGYTLTFKPSGAPRVISGTAVINRGLINLNGADRVVFDGSLSGGTDRSLTITNSQTGTSTVIWIRSASATNGANNNTIKNTIINGATAGTAQTTAGILGGSGVTIGNAAEAPNNNNTVTNNHIFRVQNSIFNQGNVGFDQNWTITNNEFGSTVEADKNRFRGMLIGNTQNFVVSGNTVNGVLSSGTTTAAMSGIQLAFALNGGSIVNNKITDIKNTSTSGTGAFGMQLSSTTSAANVLIANNFISDVAALGSATLVSNGHGINFNGAGAGGYRIYHNSINMNTNQGSGTTSALLVGSVVTGAGALDVRNNIFANTQTAGATRFAVYSAAPASVYSAINYNNYFSTENVGFLGGVRATLAEWQTATGQDANSLAVNPLFVSATDLHLQAGSPMINAGTPIAEVPTDIDGDPRSATTPDIGADEFISVAQPGTLALSSSTYSVGEGDGTVTITVNRTGGTDGAVSVNYSMTDGSATGGAACGVAGIDYVNTGGTVNFANGQSSQTFTIEICEDGIFEGNETFTVTLSNATGGATIGTPSSATVTIIDNDSPPLTPSLSINDVRVVEGDVGTTTATFTVTLANPNSNVVTVQYATKNGTATAGVDYIATSGMLTFNPGTTTQPINVTIIGDTIKEANETFFVNLFNPTNATITRAQGVGIIIDDDSAVIGDFDNDGLTDFSVYRPSTGVWFVLQSTSGTPNINTFGAPGDIIVPGDYDGDGITDRAVFRPSEGKWYITLSGNKTLSIQSWGLSGDIPVQGDYDGDGKTDLAVYRPSEGRWYILQSSGGSKVIQFGISTDRPVTGDFDGDGINDLAVYRDGVWFVLRSSDNAVRIVTFGIASDRPVSGDFDGDGKTDFAIFRNGVWWIFESLSGNVRVVSFGLANDIPAVGDYDGDGTSDIAVFRPSEGNWYVLRSSNNTVTGVKWGISGDVPIPTAYMPY